MKKESVFQSLTSKGVIRALAVSTLIFTGGLTAQAADGVWTGGNTGNWVDTANWQDEVVPGSTSVTNNTDTATFNKTLTAAGNITLPTDNLINLQNIIFSHATPSSGYGYSLGGSLNLTTGGGISNLSTGGNGNYIDQVTGTIYLYDNGINSTVTVNNSSNHRMVFRSFTSGTDEDSTVTLLLTGTSQSTDNQQIKGIKRNDTGADIAVIKDGTGRWNFSGSSEGDFVYGGGLTIKDGLLIVGYKSAFGEGTITFEGGTLRTTAATGTVLANAIEIKGDFTLDAPSRTIAFNGAVNLNDGIRKITITNASATTRGQEITFGGVVSNGGITKAGDGDLVLAGKNTYTGNTTISTGKLILSETGELAFTIGANGVNTALLGSGALQLDGTFKFDLSGADLTQGNSWQIVGGSLLTTYGDSFSIDGFTQAGTSWTLADGATTYQFAQDTGVLQIIPEPTSAWLLVWSGAFVFLFFRRKKSFSC